MINKPILLFAVAALACACAAKNDPHYAWRHTYTQIENRIHEPQFGDEVYDIRDFGAVADDSTVLNHKAINTAIAHCSTRGGGTVEVPAGVWHTGPLTLLSGVNLHLAEGSTLLFTDRLDEYPLVLTRWEGIDCYNYQPMIYALDQHDIALTGRGTIDGAASVRTWWSMCWGLETDWDERASSQKVGRPLLKSWNEQQVPVEQRVMGHGYGMRPQLVNFYRCDNILVEDVTMLRSPFWNLYPVLCNNMTVRGVHFVNDGPNGDGCDPESCNDVLIEKCFFDTGDDCIAIKSGRDQDGRRVGVPSQNMIVRDCTMRNGHGGVVVGSEISGGYRNLFVERCNMDSPKLDRAIRIKTNSRRGGVIENIYVRNIEVGQCKESFLKINLIYDQREVEEAREIVIPTVQNVFMEDVHGGRSRYGVMITALEEESHVHNICLRNCVFDTVEAETSVSGAADPVRFENVMMNGTLVEI